MIAALMAVLHLIPGFTSLATTFISKHYDSQVAMYQARWGVSRDVAITAIQAMAQDNQTKVSWIQAVSASPVFAIVVLGFALPPIIFEWKVVVIDNVIAYWGKGYTPAIGGEVGIWMGTIITGVFITAGGAGIAHTVFSNWQKDK